MAVRVRASPCAPSGRSDLARGDGPSTWESHREPGSHRFADRTHIARFEVFSRVGRPAACPRIPVALRGQRLCRGSTVHANESSDVVLRGDVGGISRLRRWSRWPSHSRNPSRGRTGQIFSRKISARVGRDPPAWRSSGPICPIEKEALNLPTVSEPRRVRPSKRCSGSTEGSPFPPSASRCRVAWRATRR